MPLIFENPFAKSRTSGVITEQTANAERYLSKICRTSIQSGGQSQLDWADIALAFFYFSRSHICSYKPIRHFKIFTKLSSCLGYQIILTVNKNYVLGLFAIPGRTATISVYTTHIYETSKNTSIMPKEKRLLPIRFMYVTYQS